MRSKLMTRTVVSLTAVAGITVGSLAGAGTAFAQSTPPAQQSTTVSTQDVAPLAVVNLGLSKKQAQKVQRGLALNWQYKGDIDGKLGPGSWKAMQRFLAQHWEYKGGIDGDPGVNTIKALQRFLKKYHGYKDAIDGDPGPNTRAAFKRFANGITNPANATL